MPKLKLAAIQNKCAKPNCTSSSRLERHHKGCQGMWVRHFAWRKRSKKYQAFKARYEEFHPADTVTICQHHHWEVHQLLWLTIGRMIREFEFIPAKFLQWRLAEKIIAECIKVTDEWLLKETPGSTKGGPNR